VAGRVGLILEPYGTSIAMIREGRLKPLGVTSNKRIEVLPEVPTHAGRLTAAGRALLPRLQSVMSDLNETLTITKRVGQGKSGALNIGYGSLTLLLSLFRAAIKQFHEMYPDVTLSLLEMPTSEHPRALADGRIHGGFMHFGPKPTMLKKRGAGALQQDETVLDWVKIQTGKLGLGVPHDHPLARRKSVVLSELANEPFVVAPVSSSSPGYGPLYTLCQKVGFEPMIVQEVSSISSQLNLISVGMGIGLAVTGKNFTYPSSLTVVPLDEVNYTTSFVFGWVKGECDPVLERMSDIVRNLAKEQ
jgi:DNA-binding transcriptional LysR family regulator